MITTKQKVSLGGLFIAAGAVWAPQVLEMVQGGAQAQIGVEGGPNEAEMLSIEQEMLGLESDDGLGYGAASMDSYESPEDDTIASEGRRASASSAALMGTDSSAVIGEVLRTLGRSEAFGFSRDLTAIAGGDLAGDFVEEEAGTAPELLTFLKENPLRGTIVGKRTSMALIGRRHVRLGEIIPGTGARLTSVDRGRATIEEAGMIVEVELAPLETSAARMHARESAAASTASRGSGSFGMPGDGVSGGAPNAGASTTQEDAATLNQKAATASDSIPNPQGDF